MRQLRRFKQALEQSDIERILIEGRYAVWAVDGDDYYPYAVPVNYAYVNGAVYIHCARNGHKMDAIRRNPKCSLCIVEKDDIVPERFTTYFRSVIVFGTAEVIEEMEAKREALKALCDKYSPGLDSTHEIEKSLGVVCIVRIRIDHCSGKQAIELC